MSKVPPDSIVDANNSLYVYPQDAQDKLYALIVRDDPSDPKYGQIKTRFDNPITGARNTTDALVNAGADAEWKQGGEIGNKPSAPLTMDIPQNVNYQDFASVQGYVPAVDEDGNPIITDLEDLTDTLVHGGKWKWTLTDKEKEKGMPDESREVASLVRGGKRLKVSKMPDGNFQVFEPGKEQKCGKDGCAVITSLNLRVNQAKVREIPQNKEKTRATIDDMLSNPWNFGEADEEDATFNNAMELPSVKRAVANAANPTVTGIDWKKYQQDFDAKGGAFSAATNWLYKNTGDKRFLFGDIWGGKWIANALEEAGFDSQYIQRAQDSLASGNPRTELPKPVLQVFLKNGQKWRQYEMLKYAQRMLKATYKDDPEMRYKQVPADPETGEEIIDPEAMSPEDRAAAMGRNITPRNRGRKRDVMTQDLTGVERIQDPEALEDEARSKVGGASKSKVKIKRRKALAEIDWDSKEYVDAYDQEFAHMKTGDLDIEASIRAAIIRGEQRRSSIGERLGAIDAAHDYMLRMLSVNPGDASDVLRNLANLVPGFVEDLKGVEKNIAPNELIDDTLLHKAAQIGTIIGVPGAEEQPQPEPQPRPQPQATPVQPNISKDVFTQQAHDAFMYRDPDLIAQVKQIASSNPEYQAILANIKNRQQQAHHDPAQPGMISFAEWRSLIETDAIYDGTPAKDGGGFNWWGAVGKAGGVSIAGEADTAEEDPTGSKGTKKKKKHDKRKTK